MTPLEQRSVLITGVGPDLGRSIALASARAGADVVLAARSGDRLEKIAEEVTALGRRAVPVAADITNPDDAERIVATGIDAFGRIDTVVHNAFAMPAMTPLADTSLEKIKTAFDVNVLAVIRLTRLLTPSLAQSPDGGSVVMVNSSVLRHSRVGFAGYKMAKSALLSLAQSLASELGPSGIRVNSVAPGWIWGSSLQWYFGYLAEQRGVTRDEVYAETADLTDLKRLPEPDQIADAVVFLASSLARAVTGQCLDVNCGEFHH
ncbi:MAG: SDR family oxidoreductase [Streptosporangiales bacterium]|nr:SDR family oxidoreductase [Streptosporangiales bacterium]